MALVVDNKLAGDASPWLPKAYAVFDELIASGNLIARSQKNELLQLEEMFRQLVAEQQNELEDTAVDLPAEAIYQYNFLTPATANAQGVAFDPAMHTSGSAVNGLFGPTSAILDRPSFENLFSGAQIMELANSIDINDTEWMSQAITDYELW